MQDNFLSCTSHDIDWKISLIADIEKEVARPAHIRLKTLLVFAVIECSIHNKEPVLE
jgi:hypothetical protein